MLNIDDFTNLMNPSTMTSTPFSNNSISTESDRFPTVGLKSLLKNSELLELLLKPLNKPDDNTSSITNCLSLDPISSDLNNSQLDLDLSLLDESKSKSLFDWENSDEYLESKF